MMMSDGTPPGPALTVHVAPRSVENATWLTEPTTPTSCSSTSGSIHERTPAVLPSVHGTVSSVASVPREATDHIALSAVSGRVQNGPLAQSTTAAAADCASMFHRLPVGDHASASAPAARKISSVLVGTPGEVSTFRVAVAV